VSSKPGEVHIEIIGALDLETSDLSSEINIIAGADTVLWGSGR